MDNTFRLHIPQKLSTTLYLFMLIFAPPIVPYAHLVLAVYSVIMLLLKYPADWKNSFFSCGAYKWVYCMAFLLLYVIVIPLPISFVCDDVVNTSNYISVFNRFAVLLVVVVSCGVYLISQISEKELTSHFIIECIIDAGAIEGVLSALAFASPSIKNLFISLMRANSGMSIYNNTWYITVRSYGFAITLSDLIGLGSAFIAGVGFIYGVLYKRKFIALSIISIIPSLLNARTGIILYLLCIAVVTILCFFSGRIKSFAYIIVSVALIALVGRYMLEWISSNKYTTGWLMNGFDSVMNFLSKDSTTSTGSGDSLYNLFHKQSWELPGGIRMFLGTAHSLYRAQGYRQSDVGYINDIWIFGIIGALVMYSVIASMIIFIIRNSSDILFRYSAVFMGIALIVFNIKGSAIGYNPGASSILTTLFCMTYFTNKELEEDTELQEYTDLQENEI